MEGLIFFFFFKFIILTSKEGETREEEGIGGDTRPPPIGSDGLIIEEKRRGLLEKNIAEAAAARCSAGLAKRTDTNANTRRGVSCHFSSQTVQLRSLLLSHHQMVSSI